MTELITNQQEDNKANHLLVVGLIHLESSASLPGILPKLFPTFSVGPSCGWALDPRFYIVIDLRHKLDPGAGQAAVLESRLGATTSLTQPPLNFCHPKGRESIVRPLHGHSVGHLPWKPVLAWLRRVGGSLADQLRILMRIRRAATTKNSQQIRPAHLDAMRRPWRDQNRVTAGHLEARTG